MTKEYYIYYKTCEGKFKIWSSETNKISTVGYEDKPKNYCYAMLSFGYVGTEEDLMRYSKDFKVWIDQLNTNNVLKIDWLKYYNNNSACRLTFQRLAKGKYEHHEQIDSVEASWMSKSHNGALTYCSPQTTQSYSYDYSLFYPRIFSGKKFYIPTKVGKEVTLKKLPDMENLQLGYYRVSVTCNNDEFRKLFAFSEDNVYVEKSLYQAVKYQEKYDVKIKLIDDGEPNAYIYEDKATGYSIFGNWYEIIIKLRELFPKNILVKFLASTLSGQLSNKHKINKTYDQIIEENLDVGSSKKNRYFKVAKHFYTKKNGEEADYYVLHDTHHPYTYNIRLMPFLTAFARNKIARLAMKDIDHCIRIHTDSVCFSVPQKFEKHHSILDYSTLKEEEKSSGLIEWKNVNSYKKV